MSQPNPRTTGLFVLGAILLVVAGLVAFGSRSYFEHRPRAVTFFHGSVAGLVVGAPVTFPGSAWARCSRFCFRPTPPTVPRKFP